jgi:hypothetical protein
MFSWVRQQIQWLIDTEADIRPWRGLYFVFIKDTTCNNPTQTVHKANPRFKNFCSETQSKLLHVFRCKNYFLTFTDKDFVTLVRRKRGSVHLHSRCHGLHVTQYTCAGGVVDFTWLGTLALAVPWTLRDSVHLHLRCRGLHVIRYTCISGAVDFILWISTLWRFFAEGVSP